VMHVHGMTRRTRAGLLSCLAICVAASMAGIFVGASLRGWVVRGEGEGKNGTVERPVFGWKQSGIPQNSPQVAWVAAVKAAGVAEFPHLLETWQQVFADDGQRGDHALAWMFGVWAAKDSKGFSRHAVRLGFEHPGLAGRAFGQLMPEQALGFICEGRRAGEWDSFAGGVLEAVAEHHPKTYLAFDPDGTFKPGADRYGREWENAIEGLAAEDPVAAATAWLKFARIEQGYDTIRPAAVAGTFRVIAEAWTDQDEPLEKWIGRIEDPVKRGVATHIRIALLAESDPALALAQLRAAGPVDGYSHSEAPLEVLSSWTEKDPVAGLKLYAEIMNGLGLSGALDPFGEVDISRIRGHVAELFVDQFSITIGSAVGDALCRTLPDAPDEVWSALGRLMGDAGVGDAAWRYELLDNVIRSKANHWTMAECFRMVDIAAQSGEDDSGKRILRSLAHVLLETDMQATLLGIDRFPQSLRAWLRTRAISRLPEWDHESRLSLLEKIPPKEWDDGLGATLGHFGERYASMLTENIGIIPLGTQRKFIRTWGNTDPEAAAAWVESLPTESVSMVLAYDMASGWMSYDGDGTTDWARRLPPGSVRDAASAAIAQTLEEDAPLDAWKWARKIENTGDKFEAYKRIAAHWKEAPREFVEEQQQARLNAERDRKNRKEEP